MPLLFRSRQLRNSEQSTLTFLKCDCLASLAYTSVIGLRLTALECVGDKKLVEPNGSS